MVDERRSVEILVGAIQELSLARNVSTVQDIVRHAARHLTGADGASFVLREGDHCYYADEDAIAPLWKGQRFPVESCISGWAMTHRRFVVIPDVYTDGRIPHDAYRPTFVTSLAVVPIRTIDPLGAIGNYWAEPHEATESEVALLQALADSTAATLERIGALAELEAHREAEQLAHRVSVTDELTGAYNRRGFMGIAGKMLASMAESHHLGAVVFVDVDGLKETNDRHGHLTGDLLIVDVARGLRNTLRAGDVMGRIGGDEFAVMLSPAAPDVTPVLERIRTEARHPVSVGGVVFVPSLRPALEDLLDRADAAMYEDKRRRRTA